MFTVIEFGRILFTLNMLDEGARRGARGSRPSAPLATPAIAQATTFVSLPGLTTSNVVTEYLDDDGSAARRPGRRRLSDSIDFVRVRIVNYSFPVAIPFIATTFTAPEISATLPRESLGVPQFGAAPAC